ncbi:hypothetical protein N7494_007881 [Penicillium frequentans]|uniref:Uncharacterized protein n=1 Tax=Penicillium frequentans TaxID=3151616 RepID=A0AAD6CUY1_9EURO|nr:hypothetical protein N7494_007881 [Penicillium glabrum]
MTSSMDMLGLSTQVMVPVHFGQLKSISTLASSIPKTRIVTLPIASTPTMNSSTNGHEQHQNSPIFHGNHVIQPEARRHILPPAPTRQNQHHYHHAHEPAPVEPQVHHLYQHMYFAHGALDPEAPYHDPEENPDLKENPRDLNKPRLRTREEDLLWGYGPPLPMLTVHRRKKNQRRRKT